MIRLSNSCALKLLEEPCVYNIATDELYILNRQGFDFLTGCVEGRPRPRAESGAAGEPDEDAAFIDYCLEEGILEPGEANRGRRFHPGESARPSLRYLLLHITDRCNLRCRHCYGGDAGRTDLDLSRMIRLLDEFETLQGLRLLISGGEPLLHPRFLDFNDCLAGRQIRTVLLSNGTLINEQTVARLAVDEVQISLDGMRAAHDRLRGAGTFDRSLAALRLLAAADVPVSVATMIHSGNLDDFDSLAELLAEIGVREWSIDLPSQTGRLTASGGLAVDPRLAAPLLSRSFGGAIHEPAPGFACGAHLMAVTAAGDAARCGFYTATPVGNIEEGLAACWEKIPKTPLTALDCDCEFLEDCRGGCRFRAEGYNNGDKGAVDICQCYRFGVK